MSRLVRSFRHWWPHPIRHRDRYPYLIVTEDGMTRIHLCAPVAPPHRGRS